jgi:hypothetical protein
MVSLYSSIISVLTSTAFTDSKPVLAGADGVDRASNFLTATVPLGMLFDLSGIKTESFAFLLNTTVLRPAC